MKFLTFNKWYYPILVYDTLVEVPLFV